MVVCGAILGVAGFAFEQGHANWRPHATRTSAGWRVTQPRLGIDGADLAGDHLAWQAGPYTIVMDLNSGATRLVGAATDAQSVWPPAVSPRGAVWMEVADGPGKQTQTLVYAYDFTSRRRRHLLQTSSDLSAASPVVTGTTAYWLSDRDGTSLVTSCDINGGGPRVLASGSDLGPFLLADGSLVIWSSQPRPSAPFSLTVLDTSSDTTSDLTLPGQSGASFDSPVLADGTLVWLRSANQSGGDAIYSYDLHTLSARQVVSGDSLVGPAFDGSTVVWAQPAASGSGDVVMGLRLPGGTPFRIAAVSGDVSSVLVSGTRVAWLVGAGPRSSLATARLPQ